MKSGDYNMAMPEIPDMKPDIDLKREDVISLLLASIALEEISLAHIMNAEAEKIQEILKTCKTDELFEINDKVDKILMKAIKKEMLLQFKFENVLELIKCKKFRKHDD